jgi:hypothetical protein
VVCDEEIVGSEEESACAAGWISDRFHRLWAKALHHCPDQGAGGEVLSGSAFGIFGVLF